MSSPETPAAPSSQVVLTEQQVEELCGLYGDMQKLEGPEYDALSRFLDDRSVDNLRALMDVAAETGEWYDALDAILEWNEGGPSIPDSWRVVSRYKMHETIHGVLMDPAEYPDVLRWMQNTTPATSAAGRDCQNILTKASELLDLCPTMPSLNQKRIARVVLDVCADRIRSGSDS